MHTPVTARELRADCRIKTDAPIYTHIHTTRPLVPSPKTQPVLGASTCCLYISLRYHLLNPEYLIRRIKELRR